MSDVSICCLKTQHTEETLLVKSPRQPIASKRRKRSSKLITPYLNQDPKFLLSFYGPTPRFISAGPYQIPFEEICRFYNDTGNLIYFNNISATLAKSPSFALPDFLSERERMSVAEFSRRHLIHGNEQVVRLKGIKLTGNKLKLTVLKAMYSQQVATNLTLDWKKFRVYLDDNRISLREYDSYMHDGNRWLPSFQNSVLANTIGMSSMILTRSRGRKRNYILLKRTGRESASGGMLAPSASGAMQWTDRLTSDAPRAIREQMSREIEEETSLRPDEYDLYPLALCREHARGGKPEFIFLAITDLPSYRVVKRVRRTPTFGEMAEHDEVLRISRTEVVARPSAFYEEPDKYALVTLAALKYAEDFLNRRL